MRRITGTRKGFTLTEILVALAIFALGGTAIMALFITNVRLSRQAMDYTRAAEITRNVRSLMTQSLSRPINLNKDDNIYAFYYPGSSLSFNPDTYRERFETGATSSGETNEANIGNPPTDNIVFFRLPKQMFNSPAINYQEPTGQLTVIPRDTLTSAGTSRSFDGPRPQVFRLMPDALRRSRAIDGLDPDDRMSYQFDVSIRRSVQRASVDATDASGAKQPLEDLFVVHVRVYKGFEFGDVVNDPYFEWDFYVNASK
ncbi:MAG: prepilin-type N-terminal cleavage/methylation domain-containing protein [Planctomycetes bacterium]|nr:prepilin-type N-terminal cleavage/methylation domain-containing protein [Planctomycetota bacterium]